MLSDVHGVTGRAILDALIGGQRNPKVLAELAKGRARARRGEHAPATVAHCETVLRGFYEFHLEAGTGPMVDPFPLARHRRGGRANAHHNPMDAFTRGRSGLFRPRVTARVAAPDSGCEVRRFVRLAWLSPGSGAAGVLDLDRGAGSELLGVTFADADPGQRLITVIRKGIRRCSLCRPRRTRSSG